MSITSGGLKNFEDAVDLSEKQYFVVDQTGDNKVDLAAAATDFVLGAVQNKPKKGEASQVILSGRTAKVKLGGTVSRGDRLTSDSAGKAIKTVTEDNLTFGEAIQAGVADDLIEYVPKLDRIEPPT